MEMQQIKIKIYLKCKRKPLCYILDTEKQVDNIIDEISIKEFVKLGDYIFKASDIKYIKIN